MDTDPDDAPGEQPTPGPVPLCVRGSLVRYGRSVDALQDVDLDVAQGTGVTAVMICTSSTQPASVLACENGDLTLAGSRCGRTGCAHPGRDPVPVFHPPGKRAFEGGRHANR